MITVIHPQYAIRFVEHAQDRIDALKKENAYLKSLLSIPAEMEVSQ